MTDYQRRCIKIWQILIASAINQQTITFGELANLLEEPGVFPLALGRYLRGIRAFCANGEYPDLTVLVVRADGTLPPEAWPDPDVANGVRIRAFCHRWFGLTPPTPGNF